MRKLRNLFLLVFLLGSLPIVGLSTISPVVAAPLAPLDDGDVSVEYIGSFIANDGAAASGTPNAAYIRVVNLTAGGTYRIKAYKGGDNYWNWNSTTNQWVYTETDPQPPIVADASGVWEGWVVFRMNIAEAIATGGVGFRVYEGSAGNTQFGTQYSADVTFMNMTSVGGWIEGIAYGLDGSTPLANAPVVVRDASNAIVGIYLSEDNSIDEGHSGGAGYYKVPAPNAGVYSVEVWDASNSIVGIATPGVTVSAGATTPNVDINSGAEFMLVHKTGPQTVEQDETFVYTLTVKNYTSGVLSDVVLSDTLPSNVNYVSSDPTGNWNAASSTITWTAASLADATTLTYTLSVSATGVPGEMIVNQDYATWASNWTTVTTSSPVQTMIGSTIPIPYIQGDGYRSPLINQSLTTRGVVLGFFEGNSSGGNFNGFFIQDPTGDGNADTSDGLFVRYSTSLNPGVSVGDVVKVTGTVNEYSEWDGTSCEGDTCWTQISIGNVSQIEHDGTASVPAVVSLNPPDGSAEASAYWESLEGMNVAYPVTATVVAPTSYGAIFVLDGALGLKRAVRTGPHAEKPVGVRHYELYGNISGGDADNLIVGSVVEDVSGPLAFSYGNHMIITQDGAPWATVTSATEPASPYSWPTASAAQFTVASFNTLNFDTGGGAVKLSKVADTIAAMGYPSFVALQEIATPGGSCTGVIDSLITELGNQGVSYAYAASHPDTGCHGAALIWRTDQVSNVVSSTDYQSCSADGSPSSSYDSMYATCQADGGKYPLFSRRPVVVTGTITADGSQVVVIANHFKSKLGGLSADQRRVEQGTFVAALADQMAASVPNVIVTGDLNDFEDASPLEALYASGLLTNSWYTLPEDQRFSYIFGGTAQTLDHILVSSSLRQKMTAMAPLHNNADFPFNPYTGNDSVIWRTSDHDTLAATFDLDAATLAITKVVAPAGVRSIGDTLTYTISLAHTDGDEITGVTMSDVLPIELDFGGWVTQPASAVQASDMLTWTGTITPSQQVTLVFTATIRTDAGSVAHTVSNVAAFTADNAVAGQDTASFDLVVVKSVFLPMVVRTH